MMAGLSQAAGVTNTGANDNLHKALRQIDDDSLRQKA